MTSVRHCSVYLKDHSKISLIVKLRGISEYSNIAMVIALIQWHCQDDSLNA